MMFGTFAFASAFAFAFAFASANTRSALFCSVMLFNVVWCRERIVPYWYVFSTSESHRMVNARALPFRSDRDGLRILNFVSSLDFALSFFRDYRNSPSW